MYFFLLMVFFLSGCQGSDLTNDAALKRKNQKGEFITRAHDQKSYIPPMEPVAPPTYDWERHDSGQITKEYFRCKGSSLNPSRVEMVRGEQVCHFDCGGSEKHGLYLIDGKENVYPILIKLMNYLQDKTGKRVVITSGYRCPTHNTYIDSSPSNQYSKHMVGAEVDFYVQGYEQNPEAIVKLLIDYYKGEKGYEEFQRYEKPSQVSTLPWMNKEIFIKVNKANEGRNFDNRHPYPYISIQVRYDREKGQRVNYSWDQAFRGYHRY